jgi:DNA-binding transcriptional MerR regulator
MKKNFAMKKLYYSISEVSKITDLEQYVLRYWETEFEQLKPAKNLAGNRIYTNKDIKLILQIKKLLKEEKYTIEGAKNYLKHIHNKEDLMQLSSEAGKSAKFPGKEYSGKNLNSELSLFNLNDLKHNSDKSVKLKKDLNELKRFLSDLLDEL